MLLANSKRCNGTDNLALGVSKYIIDQADHAGKTMEGIDYK